MQNMRAEMEQQIKLFDGRKIRAAFDEKANEWLFSVIDVVAVLIEKDYQTARNYWKVLKFRIQKESGQPVTFCNQLKMEAPDGKKRLTDVAPLRHIFRIIQSIPSHKAEPFKQWLGKVGEERVHEISDPELSLNRARDNWQRLGRSEKWIQQRMSGQETRSKLTDYWREHEISEDIEFAILTNIIHTEWTGVTVREHMNLKGLSRQNLRDHMSEAELIFTALAELSTRQIAESVNATGMKENARVAHEGGTIAKDARRELENKTGKSVVSSDNFLPPPKNAKKIGNKKK